MVATPVQPRRTPSRLWQAGVPSSWVVLILACSEGQTLTEAASRRPLSEDVTLRLVPVATGLERVVHVAAPPDDGRLFIVEQPGRIRVVRDGMLLARPFLDITDRVVEGGEQGLLSVAFDPDFAVNGYLFVDYTDLDGHTRVERYTVSAPDPDSVDSSSAKLILFVEQPYANHNGGLVAFGPDGMLYVGMGDGGGAGDPLDNAQDLTSLLGKLLRIDPRSGDPYAVPDDNPFVGQPGASPEIWAYGLRNPWRYSWDPEAGLLFIADVGQDRVEEVNAVSASAAGLDYGWDVMEGSLCFEPESGCDVTGRVLPIHEYGHDEGCAVTGGFVYRGNAIPEVRGHYFFSDSCTGWLRSFRFATEGATSVVEWPVEGLSAVTSFGVGADGELYVTSGNTTVYRIERSATN